MPDSHTGECFGFHRFMGGTILLLIAVEWPLARIVRLEGFGQLRDCGLGIALLLAIIMYCQWRKYHRLREAAIMALWMATLTVVLNVLIQICARTPAPMIDLSLARADAVMHVSALSAMDWARQSRLLQAIFTLAYGCLPLMMLLAVMVPTLLGRFRQAQQYVLAVTIGALLTGAIFALWPAAGPWVVYGYRPATNQATAQAFLLALKSQQPIAMNMDIAAIVSFPSFHVVLALLSAAALWPYRKFRLVLIVLSAVIAVSTITTGWHYIVDVLGGFAVAAAAYPLADYVLKRVVTPNAVSSARAALALQEMATPGA